MAKGIVGYNPIISGQLSREEIELSSQDDKRPLIITDKEIEIKNSENKIKKMSQYQSVRTNLTLHFGY